MGKKKKSKAIKRRQKKKSSPPPSSKETGASSRDDDAPSGDSSSGDDSDSIPPESVSDAERREDGDDYEIDRPTDSDAGDRDSDAGERGDNDAANSDRPSGLAASMASEDDEREWTENDPKIGLETGQDWGWPVVRFERRWTWLETRMLFAALISLTVVLSMWFMIRGMMEPLEATNAAGTVFRMLAGASFLGGATYILTGKANQSERNRSLATVAAVVVGIATAKLWRGVGIAYFAGLLDWLQEGSTFTLAAGLKGVSTRLTMLVALLGGSLAAASGTHIAIDVFVRFVPERLKKSVQILTLISTAGICFATAVGFADFIAVTRYGADADATGAEKRAAVTEELGHQFFILRKQMALDLRALPVVITGTRWNADERMNGQQWNDWLADAGFVEEFGEAKVATIRASKGSLDSPRTPFVVVPKDNARGYLIHLLDCVFPVGFLMIGLRMLLRALLVFAGHVDISEHHETEDEEDEDGHEAAQLAEETA